MSLSANVFTTEGQVGRIADRGTFDAHATYSPGEVVLSGGVAYVNIAPVGAGPVRWDDFARPDATGWGISGSGHYWQTGSNWAYQGPPGVRGGVGYMLQTADGTADGQLLGASADLGDAELLALVAYTPTPGTGNIDLTLGLQVSADANVGCWVEISNADAGPTQVLVFNDAGAPGGLDESFTPDPAPQPEVPFWVRFRKLSGNYSVSIWPQGSPEPATFQHTAANAAVTPPGAPLVAANGFGVTRSVRVHHFSVRQLTAAPAPADDTDHWQPLAAAFPVPTPV